MSDITPSFDAITGVTVTDEAVTFAESDVTVAGYSNVVGGSVQHEYTAYDISSATDGGTGTTSGSLSSVASFPGGVAWNDDGTKIYVLSDQPDGVGSTTLSTAYDITTVDTDSPLAELDVSSDLSGKPKGITFGDGGSQMYLTDASTGDTFSYGLSTPYDLSTASYSNKLNSSAESGDMNALEWNDDGSQLYLLDGGNSNVFAYDASTPYDLSTASYSNTSYSIAEDTLPVGLTFRPDGSQMFIGGQSTESIYEYDLSTPYDLSTASHNNVDVSMPTDERPYSVTFKPDGSEMYVFSPDADQLFEFKTSSGESLPVESTISWSSTPTDLKFWDLVTYQASPDGGSVTVDVVDSSGTVLQSDIRPDFDISSVSSETDVQIRATLDGTTGENYPALDYAARRFGR